MAIAFYGCGMPHCFPRCLITLLKMQQTGSLEFTLY